MALTRIQSSGIEGNITLGNVVISGTITDGTGAVFVAGTGSAGYTGSAGTAGTTGFTGSSGADGSIGVDGYTGSAGAAGYTGSAGTNGFTGSTGVAGGVLYAVTNSDASAYLIAGAENPALTLIKGFTYYFDVSAAGHPFWIKTSAVTGTTSAYSSGVTNNGVDSGTVSFTVPFDAPATLYYICQFHESMVGTLNIVDSMQGYTGSAGVGFTGSTGTGFTGSTGAAGAVGFTGSAGTGDGGSGSTQGALASGQVTNTFIGTGSNTEFTLTVAPISIDATIVNIDGVIQQRSTYTVSGFTLTLDQALLSGETMEVTITTYGATNFVTRTYTGDGTTANYTVTVGVTADGAIVTENGVVQTPGVDYTVSGSTLTFVTAPDSGIAIGIREIPSGSIGGTAVYSRSSVTATAGQTSFAVAYSVGYLQVYLNGVLLNATDYVATTGATVVLDEAAAEGDLVEFITYNVVPINQVPMATFNSTNITANVAITAGYSAVSVGPLTVADGVTISIAAGQKWVIL
jgi:hypothetical protein